MSGSRHHVSLSILSLLGQSVRDTPPPKVGSQSVRDTLPENAVRGRGRSRSVTPPHRKVGSRWTRPNRRVCARPPVRLPPKGVCVYYVYTKRLRKLCVYYCKYLLKKSPRKKEKNKKEKRKAPETWNHEVKPRRAGWGCIPAVEAGKGADPRAWRSCVAASGKQSAQCTWGTGNAIGWMRGGGLAGPLCLSYHVASAPRH